MVYVVDENVRLVVAGFQNCLVVMIQAASSTDSSSEERSAPEKRPVRTVPSKVHPVKNNVQKSGSPSMRPRGNSELSSQGRPVDKHPTFTPPSPPTRTPPPPQSGKKRSSPGSNSSDDSDDSPPAPARRPPVQKAASTSESDSDDDARSRQVNARINPHDTCKRVSLSFFVVHCYHWSRPSPCAHETLAHKRSTSSARLLLPPPPPPLPPTPPPPATRTHSPRPVRRRAAG